MSYYPVINQSRTGSSTSSTSSYHHLSATNPHSNIGGGSSYRAREFQANNHSAPITNSGRNTIVHHGQRAGQYGSASGYSQGADTHISSSNSRNYNGGK